MTDLPIGAQTRHPLLEPLPPVYSPGSVLTHPGTRVETEPQRGRHTLTLQSGGNGDIHIWPSLPLPKSLLFSLTPQA